MRAVLVGAALLALGCALAAGAPIADFEYDEAIARVDEQLSKLADERLLGGIAAVQKAGKLVYAKGFGFANEELDVQLDPSQVIQIGSNTKFYTAIAIYQLAEQGYLNVTDAVNPYIDPEDFGLNGTWCPRVYGREGEGCQEPTFQELLSMQSGALPVSNQACGDGRPGWTEADWYWPYRLLAAPTTYGAMTGDGPELSGSYSPADALNFVDWMSLPFAHAPGEQYCYANNNFVLAAYLVEKLSGRPFAEYITQEIFERVGMDDTYMWTGARGAMPTGIKKGEITPPGYNGIFSNASGADLPTFDNVQRNAFYMPATIPIATQGTGDAVSSVADVVKFYNTLIGSPEMLGLSRSAVAQITFPRKQMPVAPAGSRFFFGQGVGVHEFVGTNTTALEYKGSIWSISTSIRYYPVGNGSANDAVLFFSNYQPQIPPQDDGSCAIQASDGEALALDASFCAGSDTNNWVLGLLGEAFDVTSNTPGDNAAPSGAPLLPEVATSSASG